MKILDDLYVFLIKKIFFLLLFNLFFKIVSKYNLNKFGQEKFIAFLLP